MWTYRLKYAKRGRIRFISHLDVMRALVRALSRTGLPLVYTEGFNPRPKITMGAALPLGYESEAEYVDFTFAHAFSVTMVKDRLAPLLPEGLDLLALAPVDPSSPRLSSATSALYMVQLKREPTEVGKDIEEFCAKETALIERVRKDTSDIIDVKQFVKDLRTETRADGRWLRMEITLGGRGSCSAAEVAQAVLHLSPDEAKCLHIVRTEMRFSGRPLRMENAKEQEEEIKESR
ncbi:MAG: DUF2344 domain-containing protein [Candidatus Abyssobacteria bacterium SURF_5]|uniref:DUF2344 domain-containing protein n=1 Tax=Abyssobacteria bacterium (strain SURF_5) TaxID=2093360 RepID=A0A3A4N276_ABYX5|nr:MAG: DUF2344 domain-containing protein [Candidatus Abyssubacteria bacterium SURF_5]